MNEFVKGKTHSVIMRVKPQRWAWASTMVIGGLVTHHVNGQIRQAVSIANASNEIINGQTALVAATFERFAPDTASLGIPNRPDLVTVVPFAQKPHENADDQTRVVIPAEVDGHRGIFEIDLGSPFLNLNRTYLQPSLAGGVDTITDGNRVPDVSGGRAEHVHVHLRVGTLQVDAPTDPACAAAAPGRPCNAWLNHAFGNYVAFAPRLGNIGLSVLDPFETIIDYRHRRVVFIRLDSTGHRLVDVPAYTPRWSAPLLETILPYQGSDLGGLHTLPFWGIRVRPDHGTANSLVGPVPDYVLDTLNADNNTLFMEMDTGSPDNDDQMVGYPFLSKLGVVGFNHRMHQFILYRPYR